MLGARPVRGGQPSQSGSPLEYRPQLDGLRGVAAAVIVLYHCWYNKPTGGFIAVDVFFVLSGYLITAILLREHHASGRLDAVSFYQRRALRLLPALTVVLTATGAFYLGGDILFRAHLIGAHPTLIAIPLTLFYVSGWARGFHWSTLGGLAQTWSLSVEEHFYLLWPAALILIARRTPGRRVAVTATVTVALAAYRVAWLVAGASHIRLYSAPDTRMDQLLIGCLLAVLVDSGRLDRCSPRLLDVLATAAAVGLVVSVFTMSFDSDFYFVAGIPLVGLAAAIVVWHLIARPTSTPATVLSQPVAVWVGRRSYALYLWHLPIIFMLSNISLSTWLIAPATIALSVLAADLSYRYVEAPMLDRRRYPAAAR